MATAPVPNTRCFAAADGTNLPVKSASAHVTIYPGATILGGETVIGAGSTIGGNVFIMDSVAPNSLVIYDGLDMRVLSKADKKTSVDFQI